MLSFEFNGKSSEEYNLIVTTIEENDSLESYALRRVRRYQEAAMESLHPFQGFAGDHIPNADELKRELDK